MMTEPGDASTDIAELIKSRVRDIADYPQPGVMFKDITPLLADSAALAAVAVSGDEDAADQEDAAPAGATATSAMGSTRPTGSPQRQRRPGQAQRRPSGKKKRR